MYSGALHDSPYLTCVNSLWQKWWQSQIKLSFPTPILCSLNILIVFIWKSYGERENKSKRESNHPLLHSPNGHNHQAGQVKTKSQRIRWGLPCQGRCPKAWVVCCCFLRSVSGELNYSWSSQDSTGTHMGPQQHKWQLYALCHNASPMIFFFKSVFSK